MGLLQRIWLAMRACCRVLFDAELARRVEGVLQGGPESLEKPPERPPPSPPKPSRSEALTLLATLQREARLVDFLEEPIDGYSDAQIGAAVRDVHRECRKALDRFFGLQPVVSQQEGEAIEVPQDFDAERYRLTGKVLDGVPLRGRLVHHGWEATRCELPTFSGGEEAARIVAPAEVELQ